MWNKKAGKFVLLQILKSIEQGSQIFKWPECRDSNPGPLGPEDSAEKSGGAFRPVWCCLFHQKVLSKPLRSNASIRSLHNLGRRSGQPAIPGFRTVCRKSLTLSALRTVKAHFFATLNTFSCSPAVPHPPSGTGKSSRNPASSSITAGSRTTTSTMESHSGLCAFSRRKLRLGRKQHRHLLPLSLLLRYDIICVDRITGTNAQPCLLPPRAEACCKLGRWFSSGTRFPWPLTGIR